MNSSLPDPELLAFVLGVLSTGTQWSYGRFLVEAQSLLEDVTEADLWDVIEHLTTRSGRARWEENLGRVLVLVEPRRSS